MTEPMDLQQRIERLTAERDGLKKALRELVAKHDHDADKSAGGRPWFSYITPSEVTEILERFR